MEVFGGGHSRQTQVEPVATHLWAWHYAHPSSRKLHTVVDVKGLLSVLVTLELLGVDSSHRTSGFIVVERKRHKAGSLFRN